MGRGGNQTGQEGSWHWHRLHGRYATFLLTMLPGGRGKIISSWKPKRRWNGLIFSGTSLANWTCITFSTAIFLTSAAPNKRYLARSTILICRSINLPGLQIHLLIHNDSMVCFLLGGWVGGLSSSTLNTQTFRNTLERQTIK